MKQGRSKKPIGELLVAEELITQGQLLEALANRTVIDGRRERLGETIQRLGFVSPADMARIIAFQFGVEHVHDDHPLPDPALGQPVPEDLLRAHRVVPLRRGADGVVLLTSDPGDTQAVSAVSAAFDHDPQIAVGSAELIDRVIDVLCNDAPAAHQDAEHDEPSSGDADEPSPEQAPAPRADASADVAQDVPAAAGADDPSTAQGEAAAQQTGAAGEDGAAQPAPAPIPLAVTVIPADLPSPLDEIVGRAVASGASEVVLAPASGLRQRMHGVLTAPHEDPPAICDVAAALREAAGADDAGLARVTVSTTVGENGWLVEGTILPTTRGEKVTLTLSPAVLPHLALTDLGLSADQGEQLRGAMTQVGAVHVVAGPARSGRTTTASALAACIAAAGRDVTAISTSVTPQTPGADWVRAASPEAMAPLAAAAAAGGADALVLDGAVDEPTLAEAVAAARRGLSVVVIVDACDTADALVQLRSSAADADDLGVLGVVVAQRLARRLCPSCAQHDLPTSEQVAQLHLSPDEAQSQGWRTPSGCHECHGTGFSAVVPIAEVARVDESLGPVLRSGADADDLRAVLYQTGVRGLDDAAVDLGLNGLTTATDILRVLPPVGLPAAAAPGTGSRTASAEGPAPAVPRPAPAAPAEPDEPLGPLPRRTRPAPTTETTRSLFGSARAEQADQSEEAAAPEAPGEVVEEFDHEKALETARQRLEQMLQGVD